MECLQLISNRKIIQRPDLHFISFLIASYLLAVGIILSLIYLMRQVPYKTLLHCSPSGLDNQIFAER